MPAFDGLSPYLKVAAGQMLEDPEVMKLTRDLVAMRREGRQNMFASIVSGGKFGSVGRVTAANMTGPDLSRISDLEAERARILSDAMKTRLAGAKDMAKLAEGGNDLAKAFLAGEATVASANAAASAVKYKSATDRLTTMEGDLAKGEATVTDRGLYGQIRSAAEGRGGTLMPVQEGYIAFQQIPQGQFSAQEHGSVVREYLGSTSKLSPDQKAILRVQLQNKGVTQGDIEKLGLPLTGEEDAVFAANAANMTAYIQTLEERTKTVEDLSAKLDRTGVGAASFGQRVAQQGANLEKTQQLARHLEELNGMAPEAMSALKELATNPLLPDAKRRMDAIDAEVGQLKSAQGGLLKSDALLSLRSSRALPELVKNAVYVAYDKKIALADADPDADPDAKAKLEAERDERLSTVDAIGATAEGGRRAARALIREQKGLQRGVRLAAEVSDTGDVARTRERNIVASEADRAATFQATAAAGRIGRLESDEVQAAHKKTATDKSLTQDLGVGQGSRPLYGRPVAGAPPVASAPPKAETEPDEDEDGVAPKAPEAEETAAWNAPPRATQAFDRAMLRGDLVRERLAQIRGLSRA